jgi:hypothetical protein
MGEPQSGDELGRDAQAAIYDFDLVRYAHGLNGRTDPLRAASLVERWGGDSIPFRADHRSAR